MALARERGIPLVAYLYRPDSAAGAEGVLGRYAERLDALGVPHFALPDELFAGGLAYRNSPVDPHPNPRGHALVAERMRRDLVAWLAAPAPDAASDPPPVSGR